MVVSMPTDSNHVEATHFLDRAAENVRTDGGGAATETIAQLGLGYAVLALVDEIDELRRQLRERDTQ